MLWEEQSRALRLPIDVAFQRLRFAAMRRELDALRHLCRANNLGAILGTLDPQFILNDLLRAGWVIEPHANVPKFNGEPVGVALSFRQPAEMRMLLVTDPSLGDYSSRIAESLTAAAKAAGVSRQEMLLRWQRRTL